MSTITKLVNNKFGGIHRKTSSYSDEMITCSDCQNIELFFTKLNSGIGVRTAYGNESATKYDNNGTIASLIPAGEEIISIFQTVQDTKTYMICYAEGSGATSGKLYHIDVGESTITTLKSGLNKTGKACGVDYQELTKEYFIFSNSKDIVYIYTETPGGTPLQVLSASNIHLPSDPLSQQSNVVGFGMKVFDDRVWMFKGRVLYYTEMAVPTNWVPSGTATTKAGWIDNAKNITAIYNYLGSLAIFFQDSSCLLSYDGSTKYAKSEESPGGCSGYDALVFHGTDLFFYDDTKKGVFSFQQIVNGDKTLSDNIAVDLQDELNQIAKKDADKIRAVSVITQDRNEIWMITPIIEKYKVKVGDTNVEKNGTIVLIYDYIRGEWIKRKCQKINTAAMVDSTLYSGGKEVYREYTGNSFDGDYIQSYYTCSVFNYGEDNTMKITKFPPRVTVDGNRLCDFWVQYIKNYQAYKKIKKKHIKSKQLGNVLKYNSGHKWSSKEGTEHHYGYIYRPVNINSVVKLPSITFKALEMKFYTEEDARFFAIKAIEFSKLKVKQV